MKAIMISTRPQWVEKILNRIKKDEVRKGTAIYKAINKLIKEQGVAPMLIYCTHGKHLLDLRKEDTKDNYRLTNQNKSNNVRWSYPPIINGKVVARFNATAEEIKWDYESPALSKYVTCDLDEWELCDKSCLTGKEMIEYLGTENKGTAIHINNLEIFDKPKEISEFKQCKCFTCKEKIKACSLCFPKKPLTRAPQSWCYVEL